MRNANDNITQPNNSYASLTAPIELISLYGLLEVSSPCHPIYYIPLQFLFCV